MNKTSLICLLMLLFTGALTAAESHVPAPYTQATDGKGGERLLQTAVRKFEKEGAATIYLSGVAHIGTENYFTNLQAHLAEMSLVLYEGVGDVPNKGNKKKRIGSVQSTMAESLGLRFQLDTIDYDRSNFLNSDMTIDQISHLMSGGSEDDMPKREIPKLRIQSTEEETAESVVADDPEPKKLRVPSASEDTNPEFDRLMQVMDGSTAMGAMVDAMVRFIGSSPKMRALTRLMFVELLGGLQGDLSQSPAMTPEMKEMISVLIRSRNQLVLQDLRKALKDPDNKTISVFYGAGHMDDLEKRLVEEMGYEAGETEWFTSFSVNPKKEKINRAEKAILQYIINIQLQMLSPQTPKKGDGEMTNHPETQTPKE